MPQRYFRKSDPKVGLILSTGTVFKNWTLIDHDTGVVAPQMQMLVDELDKAAKSGIGGITEISRDEYDALLKKKPSKLLPRWRDEWQRPHDGRSQSGSIEPAAPEPAAVAEKPSAIPPGAVRARSK